MTLGIQDIVEVRAQITPRGAGSREFGRTLLLTTDPTLGAGAGRVGVFASMDEVARTFTPGSGSYQAAQVYFSQVPYPRNLVIGHWINTRESARLTGGSPASLETFHGRATVLTGTGTVADLVNFYGRATVLTGTGTVADLVNFYGRATVVTGTGTVADLVNFHGRTTVLTGTGTVADLVNFHGRAIAATAAVVGFTIALLANPVVLIVAAIIGAFVALGFVVYKFRRQILGALKTALAWVKGNWPLLVGILFGPFGIAAGLIFKFRDDIVDAIMWIKDKIMAIFTSLRDFIIGIWEGLGEGLAGAFRGVINAVINGLNKALEVAAGLIEGIKGALDKIPGPNPAGDFLLGVASKLRAGIPNFAIGGIVPGPLGRPLLATVHGGEMVLPPGASNVLAQMLEGFRLGPAALPQAPHYYGQMYRSSVTNRTVNINITEPIVIQTQATDAKGIAQELHEVIQDQIRNIAYDHDGPVER